MTNRYSTCGHELTLELLSQKSELLLFRALEYVVAELFTCRYVFFFSRSLSARETPKVIFQSEADVGLLHLASTAISKVPQQYEEKDLFLCGGNSVVPLHFQGQRIGFLFLEGQLNIAQVTLCKHLLHVFAHQMATLYFARIDPLSELLNRQTFDEKVMEIINGDGFVVCREGPEDRRWLLALVDIDHFKQVNDNFGHVIGDEVILLVARLLKENFRAEDYVFRYGGEEFAVLFQSHNSKAARTALERLRQAIADYRFPQVGKVTVSIGFSEVEDTLQVSEQVHKSDLALYHSKEQGRNQVTDCQDLAVQPQSQPLSDIELF